MLAEQHDVASRVRGERGVEICDKSIGVKRERDIGSQGAGGSLIPSSRPRELTTPRVWAGSIACAFATAWLKRKPLGSVVNSFVGFSGPRVTFSVFVKGISSSSG